MNNYITIIRIVLNKVIWKILTTLIVNASLTPWSEGKVGIVNIRIKYCIETKIPYYIYIDGKYKGETSKYGICKF
jgi:hypothetical protein